MSSLSFKSLPPELHTEVTKYLPVKDIISLSQTCAELGAIYGPASCQKCKLVNNHPNFFQLKEPDLRPITWDVFCSPQNYPWFKHDHLQVLHLLESPQFNQSHQDYFLTTSDKKIDFKSLKLKYYNQLRTISKLSTTDDNCFSQFIPLIPNVSLVADFLGQLSTIKSLENITQLVVKLNHVEHSSYQQIDFLKSLVNLKELSLLEPLAEGTQIKFNDLVQRITNLPKLEILELSINITKSILQAISAIPSHIKQFKLGIIGDPVSVADLDSVIVKLPVTELIKIQNFDIVSFFDYVDAPYLSKIQLTSIQMAEFLSGNPKVFPHIQDVVIDANVIDNYIQTRIETFESILCLPCYMLSLVNLRRFEIMVPLYPILDFRQHFFQGSDDADLDDCESQPIEKNLVSNAEEEEETVAVMDKNVKRLIEFKEIINEMFDCVRNFHGSKIPRASDYLNYFDLDTDFEDENIKEESQLFRINSIAQYFKRKLEKKFLPKFQKHYPLILSILAMPNSFDEETYNNKPIYSWPSLFHCYYFIMLFECFGASFSQLLNLEYATFSMQAYTEEKDDWDANVLNDNMRSVVSPLNGPQFNRFVSTHKKLRQLNLINCPTDKDVTNIGYKDKDIYKGEISEREKGYPFGSYMTKTKYQLPCYDEYAYSTVIDTDGMRKKYQKTLQRRPELSSPIVENETLFPCLYKLMM